MLGRECRNNHGECGGGYGHGQAPAEPCPFPISSLEICICLERVALQPVSKTMGDTIRVSSSEAEGKHELH